MPLFLERFILPVCVTVAVLLAITNPMGLDSHQRISGVIAVVAIAYFTAHSLHKKPIVPSALTMEPTIRVDIPSVILEEGRVTFDVVVVNTSDKHRVAINIESFSITLDPPDPKRRRFTAIGISAKGMKTNLDPEEETRGIVIVSLSPDYYASTFRGKRYTMTVRLKDRISGYFADVPVPGEYPPGGAHLT